MFSTYVSCAYVESILCLGTFPYGVSGQVWYLIASIPDLCLLLYFGLFSLTRLINSLIQDNECSILFIICH